MDILESSTPKNPYAREKKSKKQEQKPFGNWLAVIDAKEFGKVKEYGI
jgi:hypothetical protein